MHYIVVYIYVPNTRNGRRERGARVVAWLVVRRRHKRVTKDKIEKNRFFKKKKNSTEKNPA